MVKLLKILMRFIGIILEWSLILLIFISFAIRSSQFQTFLGQKATQYFSKELKTKISIEKVDIYFFDKVALDGVFVLDQKNDTLADLKSIHVVLNKFDSKNKIIDLKEVVLKNGNVKLNREKKKGEFNFQFISDYFASTDTTASEPFEIKLNTIRLKQINFKYDDNRSAYTLYGIDYAHLNFKNLYLNASNFKILKSGGLETYVKHISFREKSGFNLNKFSSKIAFDDKGLRMNYLRIITPKSKIFFSKLNLNIEKPEDFSEFVDKVVFDVSMNKSIISLDDISIFANALEGMKQKIVMQAEITNRIKDLKLANLDIQTGKKTKIQGTFNLPDFRELDKAFFNERITYANIDLKDIEAILLPVSSKDRHIKLDASVQKLKQIRIKDFRLDGMYSNFVIKSDLIATNLGSIEMDNGIMFTEHKDRNSFTFEKSFGSDYDIKIDSFQLGDFISNKEIGALTGNFFLEGELFSSGKVDINSIQGDLKKFHLMDYTYNDIIIKEGYFVNNVFEGKVDIEDDNLNLTYNGLLDLNKNQRFIFDIDITEAILDNLNLTKVENNVLKSKFSVDIYGTNTTNYSGEISLNGLFYSEGDKNFEIPSMKIKMDRSESIDILTITSQALNAFVKGKIDFATVGDDINNQFNTIFPAIFKQKVVKPAKQKNKFEYRIEFLEVNNFLNIFVPSLKIANGSKIDGYYDAYKNDFALNLNSSKISYDEIVLTNLQVTQLVNKNSLDAQFSVEKFNVNDSLFVSNATFTATGEKDEINSELKWNPNTSNETFFHWKTIVNDLNSYFFNLNPSYFVIKGHKWDIVDNSQILLAPKDIQIQNFKMQRDNQFLTIDGCISEQNKDILKLEISNLELEDFTSVLGLDMNIQGELNGAATISDPFNNVSFTSNAAIRDLVINGGEVGDINLNGAWAKASQSIDLDGELFYKKNKSFNFDGSYYLKKDKDNLNFDLDFDYTDIQFANAFMDPLVISGIRGLIDGKLKITGSPEEPVINGLIDLKGGNAKVEMFGVNFGFNGEIALDKDGIYIDNMPLIDEDGNTGALVGTVFHNNFADWNFDLAFNLIDDAYALKNFRREQALERFLVMNTVHKEGDIYNGKAYVTGTANIYGYADNLNIDVDLKTEKDTKIEFPMYGAGEIGENDWIKFTPKDKLAAVIPDKIDFSGINMSLNFNVTPEAELKIIFNPDLHDEIIAFGEGNIAMDISGFGDVKMDGVFKIADGSYYNFVMPPVPPQIFQIEKGGTISWSGDVYETQLDLKTYNEVTTTLANIMPNIEDSKSSQSKSVRCYLNLTGKLSDSDIMKFDIEIPKATDGERSALARIKSVPDELNKQFFSLLIFKKFQPTAGNGNASGSSDAALDIASSQINDALNSMTDKFKVNVGLKETEQKFGLEKKLLNDRLIIKGSLGVENSSAQTSSFIGDINLEYLINEDGTFRISIFNESNENSVIQEKTSGQFTQGAGLNYQEDFNNFQDFKMAQYFLDLFRKQGAKKYPIKKKRRQKSVPKNGISSNAIKPDEVD